MIFIRNFATVDVTTKGNHMNNIFTVSTDESLDDVLRSLEISDEAVELAANPCEATANTARSAGIRGCPGC
jgi:hypothetical protein